MRSREYVVGRNQRQYTLYQQTNQQTNLMKVSRRIEMGDLTKSSRPHCSTVELLFTHSRKEPGGRVATIHA